jgi:hypothetical protein
MILGHPEGCSAGSGRVGKRERGPAAEKWSCPALFKCLHQMYLLLTSIIMTRTTLDLDSSVLEQLRSRARAEHKSMGQLASERLAVTLRQDTPVELAPLRWPSRPMGKPKVDLQDKDALWRILDGEPSESQTS